MNSFNRYNELFKEDNTWLEEYQYIFFLNFNNERRENNE